MSILDKLPPAPEGYKWWVSPVIPSQTPEDTVCVELRRDLEGGRPKVYVWGARAYAEADEACIVMAADECLDNFRQEEEVTISYLAEEKRMKEKYAHLLTE